jgi:hypothetical protein
MAKMLMVKMLMAKIKRTLAGGVALSLSLAIMSCGGGGGGAAPSSPVVPVTPAANVVAVVVDAGPDSATNPTANTLYTTVTVCVPGSVTECQTIDHIQVDTGSYGLRILAPVLTLSLPVVMASDGNSLVECTQFVDGYSWGPVAYADVQVSDELAGNVPIQVIGASNVPTPPADCLNKGTAENTVAAFGANGILGIGVFEQDCGPGCADNLMNGYYYSCTTAVCANIAAPLASQVLNPVPKFPTDNNGTILVLPSVTAPGATTVAGSLIFGIDTQTNNASGSQTVLNVDTIYGDFTTTFNGQTLTQSFLDSGTNGLYFNDTAFEASSACADPNFSGFYCPASTQTFNATLTGANNTAKAVTFTVGNAQTLATDNPTFTVFPTLAGTFSTSPNSFDWGLPFFYGRRVATAIENRATAVGTGPYVAF